MAVHQELDGRSRRGSSDQLHHANAGVITAIGDAAPHICATVPRP
jgi:hypothetical protein